MQTKKEKVTGYMRQTHLADYSTATYKSMNLSIKSKSDTGGGGMGEGEGGVEGEFDCEEQLTARGSHQV